MNSKSSLMVGACLGLLAAFAWSVWTTSDREVDPAVESVASDSGGSGDPESAGDLIATGGSVTRVELDADPAPVGTDTAEVPAEPLTLQEKYRDATNEELRAAARAVRSKWATLEVSLANELREANAPTIAKEDTIKGYRYTTVTMNGQTVWYEISPLQYPEVYELMEEYLWLDEISGLAAERRESQMQNRED